jgi:hypothetical protein
VFNAVVFANPENKLGRDWLASSYEQMGFQAESGAWRGYYLTGAAELRRGLPVDQAIRLGNRGLPERCADGGAVQRAGRPLRAGEADARSVHAELCLPGHGRDADAGRWHPHGVPAAGVCVRVASCNADDFPSRPSTI